MDIQIKNEELGVHKCYHKPEVGVYAWNDMVPKRTWCNCTPRYANLAIPLCPKCGDTKKCGEECGWYFCKDCDLQWNPHGKIMPRQHYK